MTGINKPLSSEAEQILGEVDQKNRTEAEDWLTPFARRSNEALAKRAAKKQLEKPPNEQALVEALARKDRTEYDKMRGELADTLGFASARWMTKSKPSARSLRPQAP
jgi:hypothetical protein